MKRKNLLRAMRAKLASKAGDSLAEVLFALLISALAIVMLANMIVASSDIVRRSKATFDRYYAANNALSEYSGSGTTSTATLSDGSNAIQLVKGAASQTVTCYENTNAPDSTPVISYRK